MGHDCLGVIKYLDRHVVNVDGSPAPRPNAICIHEIDNGIEWKHTNHRTGKGLSCVGVNSSCIPSSRWPITSTYLPGFSTSPEKSSLKLKQPVFYRHSQLTRTPALLGAHESLTVSWRLTISTCSMFASTRRLAGTRTRSYTLTLFRLPWDKELNPLGTGYVSKETLVHRAGPVEDSVADGRNFKIINPSTQNPVSMTPIGYKIVPIRSQMLDRQA